MVMDMDMESDRISLSALCRDICDCMGIDAPSAAEPSGREAEEPRRGQEV